jgi:hypothetical protein
VELEDSDGHWHAKWLLILYAHHLPVAHQDPWSRDLSLDRSGCTPLYCTTHLHLLLAAAPLQVRHHLLAAAAAGLVQWHRAPPEWRGAGRQQVDNSTDSMACGSHAEGLWLPLWGFKWQRVAEMATMAAMIAASSHPSTCAFHSHVMH